MQRSCILLFLSALFLGCAKPEEKPAPVVQIINAGPPQYWDMKNFLAEYSLPRDVDDFYAQFRETPGCSFGVVRAHKRLSERSHQEHDLLLYVHTGEAGITVEDNNYTIKTGDVVYVPRGLKYSAESSNGKPLDFFAVYYPSFKGEDIIYHEPPGSAQ